VISSLARSSAFAALIWWVVPIAGLLGGLGYVVWAKNFQLKKYFQPKRLHYLKMALAHLKNSSY
jgi:nitrate reductase NapE component